MAYKVHNTKYKKNHNTYVYGNTAKVMETAPLRKHTPEIVRKKRHQRTEQERQEERVRIRRIRRNNHMNLVYTLAVSGVVVVMFIICWQYLRVQAQVKENASTVSKLQAELIELTNQNDETELDINANIDYEALYDIATQELGMVYPDKDQVIKYEAGVSEYVKQYGDIPAAE